MSLAGMSVEIGFSETTQFISHEAGGSHDGQRTVLVVISSDTVTINSIDDGLAPGTDGGFTLQHTYTAQGRTFWLYDKICDASEPLGYQINFTSTGTSGLLCACLADWAVAGDAIRAAGFADMGSGTTLTLPSVSAAGADDLFAAVWDQPGSSGDAGRAHPQSPLSSISGGGQGSLHWIEFAKESYRSSTATGTRSYVASSTFDAAVGVLMIIGEYTPTPTGGWGAGLIRMGAN